PTRDLVQTSAQCATARKLWHRVLYPIRLHWHFQFRELCAGARTALAWSHGTWLCLSRFPAFDCDHPFRRRSGATIWHTADLLECLGARWTRATCFTGAESAACCHRLDADRCRYIFPASGGNRLCRPRRN